MTLKFVLYANQKSCLIVIPSVLDVNRTLGCYIGGALRDQLNNSFERDQDNSDDRFLIKRCGGDSKIHDYLLSLSIDGHVITSIQFFY